MTKSAYASLELIICIVATLAFAACSSSNGKARGPDGGCTAGSETCPCYGNNTCNAGLTCASDLCVNLTSSGSGGSGATTGAAGAGATGSGGSPSTGSGGSPSTGSGGSPSTGSGGSPSTGSGGSPSTGSGGSPSTGSGGSPSTGSGGSVSSGTGGSGSAGSGGSGTSTGTGGSSTCSCSGSDQCTTDGHCTNPDVISDFWNCSASIDLIGGRTGNWYAAADVGVNLAFAVSAPPSGFSDMACGAWSTGGPTGNGTTTYAIMGVTLVSGALPYSLAGYSGLSVNIETGQSVGFVVKTSGSGYFQYTLAATSGAQTYTVPFSSFAVRGDSQVATLNLAQVTDIQFNVLQPGMGYGFVVHALSLY
jgi:hypothetical protein